MAIGIPLSWSAARPRRKLLTAVRWRTTPTLRLGRAVRPQCRLELALCALYRCQREWSAEALVARLALAPPGADGAEGRPSDALPPRRARLGRSAARRAVERWVVRGVLLQRGSAPAE